MKSALESLQIQIPFERSITSFCGLRAVGSEGDFIIRPACKGMINVGGIESPGLTASPAIAPYVVELLQAEELECSPNPHFCPTRASKHAFREGTLEERNAIIARSPAYGKIVCRCEGISEGEILDAIRSNPPAHDVDGVKRRTRAGMGRCQGGFCAPYVMELIAKEQGIALESVTKSGGNSRMAVGRTKEAENENG